MRVLMFYNQMVEGGGNKKIHPRMDGKCRPKKRTFYLLVFCLIFF